ncbi:MAG: hypothetical protein F6K14_14210 [Symploca sp. SIO2C1]|nr:hypothetical protein [Symploca sp. SIO2C1]
MTKISRALPIAKPNANSLLLRYEESYTQPTRYVIALLQKPQAIALLH